MNDDPAETVDCECGKPADYDFAATCTPSKKESNFEPYWEEHIHPYPVYITSAKDLDREMAKRGKLHLPPGNSHKRAPEYCRQRSAMRPPTGRDRSAWLKEGS
jgi:hypothetical protein